MTKLVVFGLFYNLQVLKWCTGSNVPPWTSLKMFMSASFSSPSRSCIRAKDEWTVTGCCSHCTLPWLMVPLRSCCFHSLSSFKGNANIKWQFAALSPPCKAPLHVQSILLRSIKRHGDSFTSQTFGSMETQRGTLVGTITYLQLFHNMPQSETETCRDCLSPIRRHTEVVRGGWRQLTFDVPLSNIVTGLLDDVWKKKTMSNVLWFD